MKDLDFLAEALDEVQDEYIWDAQSARRMTRELWVCLAAWLIAAFLAVQVYQRFTFVERGITFPVVTQQEILAGENAEMLDFVVYENKIYVKLAQIPISEITLGGRLTTVEASIDEEMPRAEYESRTGSIGGELYLVPGYSVTFLLALKQGDTCCILIQNNALTLQMGSDLFEDRIWLVKHCEGVQYQPREEWLQETENFLTYGEEHRETLAVFCEALNQSLWLAKDDIAWPTGHFDEELEIGRLYFRMDSGFDVELRCYEGGYVAFEGFPGAFLKIDEAIFREVCAIW